MAQLDWILPFLPLLSSSSVAHWRSQLRGLGEGWHHSRVGLNLCEARLHYNQFLHICMGLPQTDMMIDVLKAHSEVVRPYTTYWGRGLWPLDIFPDGWWLWHGIFQWCCSGDIGSGDWDTFGGGGLADSVIASLLRCTHSGSWGWVHTCMLSRDHRGIAAPPPSHTHSHCCCTWP